MKEAYEKLIGDLDRTLKLGTLMWLAAKPEDKPPAQKTIDDLLDERLRLMKIRDSL